MVISLPATETSHNIYWTQSSIEPKERHARLGHKSAVLWITGLSGSGKSTIAYNLEAELFKRNKLVFVLEGDNVRHGLCQDLKFSEADRKENIRRAGEVAKLLMEAGCIVIAAFISPFAADRQGVRDLVGEEQFIELFCDSSLAICEKRDLKGLYKKARAGLIPDFTGISSPYERPSKPDICLNTGEKSVSSCLMEVTDYLQEKHII